MRDSYLHLPSVHRFPFKAYFLALMCALLAGAIAAMLPYWLVIALIFMPIFVICAWNWPEYGVIGVCLLVYGVIPEQYVPQIPIGPGKIMAAELALIALAGVMLLRFGLEHRRWWPGLRPYVWPIGTLILLAIASVIYAFFFLHTPVKHILNEARIFAYWLLVPILAMILNSEKKLDRFALAVLVLGLILAFIGCLQSFFNISILSGASRVEELVTVDKSYSDVIRSTAGGIKIILFAMALLLARRILKTFPLIWTVIYMVILLLGTLVTFGRGVWYSTAIGLVLMGWLIGGAKLSFKVTIVSIIMLALTMALLALIKPNTFQAVIDRAVSVGEELGRGASLAWRYQENEFAIKAITKNPALGVGLGGEYKPTLISVKQFEAQSRYIHNGYFYLGLKLGVLGMLVPFWLTFVLFRNGRRLLRSSDIQPRHRALVVAALTGFILPMITSVTQPEWMAHSGITFFALMIGLVIAVTNAYGYRPDRENSYR